MTRAVCVFVALALAIGCGVKAPPIRSVEEPPVETAEAQPESEQQEEEEE